MGDSRNPVAQARTLRACRQQKQTPCRGGQLRGFLSGGHQAKRELGADQQPRRRRRTLPTSPGELAEAPGRPQQHTLQNRLCLGDGVTGSLRPGTALLPATRAALAIPRTNKHDEHQEEPLQEEVEADSGGLGFRVYRI